MSACAKLTSDCVLDRFEAAVSPARSLQATEVVELEPWHHGAQRGPLARRSLHILLRVVAATEGYRCAHARRNARTRRAETNRS